MQLLNDEQSFNTLGNLFHRLDLYLMIFLPILPKYL